MKIVVAAIALLALVALPRAASAEEHGNSPKTDLHLSRNLVVGTTTLKPGDYTFQCLEIDGKHFLVAKTAEGEEVVRVPCEPETLPRKNATSDFRTMSKDGTQYLTAVRIKGETVAHRVAGGPAA